MSSARKFYSFLVLAGFFLIAVNLALAQELGTTTTFAGTGFVGGTNGPGTVARFQFPQGVAVDSAGNVYIADTGNQRIRKISPAGLVSTLAGLMSAGYVDGPATLAQFKSPGGVTVDSVGNVYVADSGNQRIRKIDPQGNVSTLAGTGNVGFNNGPGETAWFNAPIDVAVDKAGNVYVADQVNHRIRKIDPAGMVSTFAGSGVNSFADGPATLAQFSYPVGIAIDAAGNVYVADTGNQRIRKIDPQGNVSTLAGTGDYGFADGPGASAQFNNPFGIDVDVFSNIYVTDYSGHRVRRVDSAGNVSTLAGTGIEGFADGPGASARFNYPFGAAVDAAGNVYVADQVNHRIRKVVGREPAFASLRFANVFGAPGGRAIVGVTLDANVPIAGLQFRIQPIDPSGSPSVYALFEGVINNVEDLGFTASYAIGDNGAVSVIFYSLDGSALPPGQNRVLDLVYTLTPDVPYPWQIDLESWDIEVVDSQGETVPWQLQEGLIHVGALGDVAGGELGDSDGRINILDVVKEVRYILGLTPMPTDPFRLWLADPTSDGQINILDIIWMVNAILGINPPSKPIPASPAMVALGDLLILPNSQTAIPVVLESGDGVAGLQVELAFESGQVSLGKPRLADDASGLTLQYAFTGGKLRILIYGLDGQLIQPGTALLIPVTGRGEAITLTEVVLADRWAQEIPVTIGVATARTASAPSVFALHANQPNPFNPSTTISYDVPQQAHVTLIVYNVLGQEVARLADKIHAPGRYSAVWSGTDSSGRKAASGVYFYRLQSATGFSSVRRMTLLK